MWKRSLIITLAGITVPCLVITKKWPWEHDLASLSSLASGNRPTTESVQKQPIAMSSSQPVITEAQADEKLANLKNVPIEEAVKLAKQKPTCGTTKIEFIVVSNDMVYTTIPNFSNQNLCIGVGEVTFVVPPQSQVTTIIVLPNWGPLQKL